MNTEQVDILYAEDNPEDVEMTLEGLKKVNLGNNIFIAGDGEEALEFIFATGKYADRSSSDIPKLILLDLKMPKVSGLEVLKKIRADERTKTIPVVMLTSSAEETDLVESYKLGVNSYIVKPIDYKSFIKSITEIGYYWVVMNKMVK